MFEQETRGGSTPWNGLARKTLRHLPRHRSSIAEDPWGTQFPQGCDQALFSLHCDS
jgi:hypothetical protein